MTQNFDWIKLISELTPIISVLVTAWIAYISLVRQSRDASSVIYRERHELLTDRFSKIITLGYKLEQYRTAEKSCLKAGNKEGVLKCQEKVSNTYDEILQISHDVRMRIYRDDDFELFNTMLKKVLVSELTPEEVPEFIRVCRELVNRDFETTKKNMGLH